MTQRVTATGLHIPPELIARLGWREGQDVDIRVDENGITIVPVSDLEERIKIRGPDYEKLFSAPYHLGKTVAEAPEEYRRRSPARNAAKLQTPLLIHTTTNDEDVKVTEVLKLINALKAEGKDFQYRIYTNAPGGHLFNRLDTPTAQESRIEIWHFLAKYLKPPNRLR